MDQLTTQSGVVTCVSRVVAGRGFNPLAGKAKRCDGAQEGKTWAAPLRHETRTGTELKHALSNIIVVQQEVNQ